MSSATRRLRCVETGTVERGHSMKSRISEIGYAVMDLIEVYQIAKDCEYVRDPVCYALYQTWRKYDRARKEKEGDTIDNGSC